MNTLIVNGSPRKNGATALLIRELAARLGGDINIVDTCESGFSPCVDCRYCWDHPECALDDGMRHVHRWIDEADVIVIASPVYFAELTGPLLTWASRLQCLWAAERFRDQPLLSARSRKGAVLLAAGGQGPTEGALAMGRRLLTVMGAECVGEAVLTGTDNADHASLEAQAKSLLDTASLDKLLNQSNA